MNKLLIALALLSAFCISCQKDLHEDLSQSEYYLKADSTSLLLSAETDGKDSFRIQSNIKWQISIIPATADWLTTEKNSGDGDILVRIAVKNKNAGDTVRKATIIISAVNNPTVKPVSISVFQSKTGKKIRNAFGGSADDDLFCAVATADGGIIAVGYSTSRDGDLTSNKGQEDAWIIKLDANGEKIWQKSLGGTGRDGSAYITPTSDGNFLITAYGSSNGDFTGVDGINGTMVVKIDGSGNILWKKGIAFGVVSIIAVPGGGYMVAGTVNNDYVLAKTDENFAIVWQKTYGGTGQDFAATMVEASDNGYIIAGFSDSQDGDVTDSKGNGDYWVIKVDPAGTLVWQKCYGGSSYEYCSGLAKTQDGGYLIVGSAYSEDKDVVGHHPNTGYSNDQADGWVVKINAGGNKVWAKTFGGSMGDDIHCVTPAKGGGYLLAGFTRSDDGDITNLKGVSDAWAMKIGESGDIIWTKNPGGTDEEYGEYVVEPTQGNYVLVGNTFSNDGDVIGLNGYGDGWIYKFR